jgi:hypothetical protein
VSITRVGLSETDQFAEGYDAIFGGRKKAAAKAPADKKRPVAKARSAKKKPAKKK